MSVLPILLWPDPRLSQTCAPVETTDEGLIRDMFDTLYDASGRGLAAPQIGVMQRLFVMDCGWKEGNPTPMVVINPETETLGGGTDSMDEGCLSIPGITIPVERPKAVRLTWINEAGARRSAEFDGFEARCIQHEADHLDGVVTFDHLDNGGRTSALARYHEVTQ